MISLGSSKVEIKMSAPLGTFLQVLIEQRTMMCAVDYFIYPIRARAFREQASYAYIIHISITRFAIVSAILKMIQHILGPPSCGGSPGLVSPEDHILGYRVNMRTLMPHYMTESKTSPQFLLLASET